MKKSRLTEEQIAYAPRQAEAGTPIGDVCGQLGVSEATFYVEDIATFVRRTTKLRMPRLEKNTYEWFLVAVESVGCGPWSNSRATDLTPVLVRFGVRVRG